jgi:transcriptional regulator GlxA family with amidase domain
MTSSAKRVAIIVFDGVQPIDVSGPMSVFSVANEHQPGAYSLFIASPRGGEVSTNAGLTFSRTLPLEQLPLDLDTALIAGGSDEGLLQTIVEGDVGAWLKARASSLRRFGSVCSGAFVLASTGLLDGRRAATHWRSCGWLAELFPAVQVDSESIFAFDGPVFTSAGITAAIDLSLALVEADYGHALASAVARQLVVYLRRPGGQSQFSDVLQAQSVSPGFSELIGWMSEHLARDLRLPALARRVGMSQRNFTRRFTREVGQTPGTYVERLRVERARTLLEVSSWSQKQLAARCGFGSVDTLQRAFMRHLRVSPAEYRRGFARVAPA